LNPPTSLPQIDTDIIAYAAISIVPSVPMAVNWPQAPAPISDPPTPQNLVAAFEYVADVSQVATGASRLHDSISYLGQVNDGVIGNFFPYFCGNQF
jgi:hypothetical protein